VLFVLTCPAYDRTTKNRVHYCHAINPAMNYRMNLWYRTLRSSFWLIWHFQLSVGNERKATKHKVFVVLNKHTQIAYTIIFISVMFSLNPNYVQRSLRGNNNRYRLLLIVTFNYFVNSNYYYAMQSRFIINHINPDGPCCREQSFTIYKK
jgi:hypothetical protein